MKQKLLKIVLLSAISFNCSSQLLIDKIDPSNSGILFKNNLDTSTLPKIEGSQYFVSLFEMAEVSGISTKMMLRYNTLTDIIEVENDKKELFSLTKKDPYNTITFISNLRTIKLLYFRNKTVEHYGYLIELLNKNQIGLHKREKINLQAAKEAINSYVPDKSARYTKADDEYYLKLKDGKAFLMPKNKQELIDLFPLYKKELDTYFKKNDYSLKNEKSIVELVKFIINFHPL